MTKAELKTLVSRALDYLPDDKQWSFPLKMDLRLVEEGHGSVDPCLDYLRVECPKMPGEGELLHDGRLLPEPRFPLSFDDFLTVEQGCSVPPNTI